jgi:hypothetical protein
MTVQKNTVYNFCSEMPGIIRDSLCLFSGLEYKKLCQSAALNMEFKTQKRYESIDPLFSSYSKSNISYKAGKRNLIFAIKIVLIAKPRSNQNDLFC